MPLKDDRKNRQMLVVMYLKDPNQKARVRKM